METWLTFAIKRPGPVVKQGYPGAASRTLAEVEGETKHSAEGSYAAAMGELDKLTRQASWHFTACKDGRLYQHYPLESITWHCGLPGDRRQDTSLVGNLTLIGVEHEGGGPDAPGEPLTEPQLQATLRLTQEVRRLCPSVGAPVLRKNLWEHGWLSSTSCPSGRIPWPKFLEEDEMTQAEFNEMFKKAWETLGVTRDDRRPGSEGMVLWATPARIAEAIWEHREAPHGGGLALPKTVKISEPD